jgi:hypothetical protein
LEAVATELDMLFVESRGHRTEMELFFTVCHQVVLGLLSRRVYKRKSTSAKSPLYKRYCRSLMPLPALVARHPPRVVFILPECQRIVAFGDLPQPTNIIA